MLDARLILELHAGSTLLMAGLCWFVQVVHYPLLSRIPADGFHAYSLAHQSKTTIIVAPLMLVELASTLWILIMLDAPGLVSLAWIGLGLLGVVWASTFGVQVPLHQRLARRATPGLLRALVLTNWVRTAAWSARGILALAMLRVFSGHAD